MTTLIIKSIIKYLLAVALGILLGNSAVWVFNKIPGRWLTDYGLEPSDELLHPTTQRIKSTPWKYVFTGCFVVIALYFSVQDFKIMFPSLLAVWLLLELSIADIKYTIVPDQLVLFLSATAIGFIALDDKAGFGKDVIINRLLGAAAGFLVCFLMALLGRIIYKQNTLGGGDIKLYGALGLISGIKGVLTIFVIATFSGAIHFTVLLVLGKAGLKDRRPIVPYIAIGTLLWLMLRNTAVYSII